VGKKLKNIAPNVLIDDVTVVVSNSVYKGIVCRKFSIETSYNEKK